MVYGQDSETREETVLYRTKKTVDCGRNPSRRPDAAVVYEL